jgi:O-antigen ligase
MQRPRSTPGTRITVLFATSALLVVCALFCANWPLYQYLVLDGLIPLYYYLGALAIAAVMVAFQPRLMAPLFNEPLFYWFVVYAVSGLVWVVVSGEYLDPVNGGWRLRFLAALLFCTVFLLAHQSRAGIVGGLLFVCALATAATFWHDFLNPFLYVPKIIPESNPGRAAGFFINANQAGDALIAMSIAAMPFLRPSMRPFLMMAMLFGVFPTFSRSSSTFAVFVAVVWVWRRQLSRTTLIMLLLVLPAALVIGYDMFNVGITSAEINFNNVMDRLDFFFNLGATSDYSADTRQYVAELAWRKFSEYPFTGLGVGATNTGGGGGVWGFPLSTHNMFLLLLTEQGLFGGALYLVFVGYCFRSGYRLLKSEQSREGRDIGVAIILVALYFSFIGLFSHTLLEEPLSILVLAFLIAVARRRRSDQQASSRAAVETR